MLDGKGNVVQPDFITIYYKRLPDSDSRCHPETNTAALGKCIALPNGLRFISGSNMQGGYRQAHLPAHVAYAWPYRYNCVTSNGSSNSGSGWYMSLDEATPNCAVGDSIEAIVQMPSCWDGKNLDVPDHGSHVDYPYNGRCDDAHPFVIPAFLISVAYRIAPGDDASKWTLSSDAMDPSKPRGWSLHADWFGAWDPQTLATWTDNCINKHLSCTGGDLGNGTQMKGAMQPSYGWTNPKHLVPIPAGGMAM
ncbi:hypothetical protein GCM10022276_10760 [Sphingomonas limnosediminicola]|uniref:DUF1996 domain-containing protein n=2 Tax=Sphingomonas limnosediminicola TaxID=940133 RepID=A0ABP7L1T7_9SPHN